MNIDVTINRERGIGGSDTYALMKRDWYNLWLLKTKRKKPANFSNKLNVQIGIATEHVNEKFLQKKLKLYWEPFSEGQLVSEHKKLLTNKGGICYAHYDGYIPQLNYLVEYKHTGDISFHTGTQKKISEVKQNYMAQLQHYMYVANKEAIYLSVIFGNNRHEYELIYRDEEFINRLLGYEKAFWSYVVTDTPPSIILKEKN